MKEQPIGAKDQEQPEQEGTESSAPRSALGEDASQRKPSDYDAYHSTKEIEHFLECLRNIAYNVWENHKFRQLRTDPRSWLEIIGILILLFYTIYTGETLREIRKQTPRIAESAESAKKAIFYSRSAMVISEQATVVVPETLDAKFGIDSQSGKRSWTFLFSAENGGNTPALDVGVHINDNAPEFRKLPDTFDYKDMPAASVGLFLNIQPSKPGFMIIGAHSQERIGGLAVREDSLQKVDLGKAHIYFWGRVTYRDVFGCKHQTDFCREIVYFVPNGNQAAWAAAWCTKHNCVDQDCEEFEPTNNELCSADIPKSLGQ